MTMNSAAGVLLTFFLIIGSITFSANPGTEALRSNPYQNYLTCLALCGKRHTNPVNKTLLSGEIVTEWIKDTQFFDICDSFCQERENYPVSSKLEPLPATNFDRIEVTCIEKESASPLRVRVQLHIPRQDEFPTNATLFIIETWRSLAEEGGVIRNSLSGRYFTFSTLFGASYTFSGNPNQENLYVRIFAYSTTGPVGKPMCTTTVAPRSLFNYQKKPLTLEHVPQNPLQNSTVSFIRWAVQDELAPPECDQVLQSTTTQRARTKWIKLDSSHLIPVEINENFTYKIKMSGLQSYKSNSDYPSTLLIESVYEESSEDFMNRLDRYFGLLIALCIMLLLILVLICFLCCRRSRSKHTTYMPNSIHPTPKSGNTDDTTTEDTTTVEPGTLDCIHSKQPVPLGLNNFEYGGEIMNYFAPSHPFPADERQKTPIRPRQTRKNPPNAVVTSTPNGLSQSGVAFTRPIEDFV